MRSIIRELFEEGRKKEHFLGNSCDPSSIIQYRYMHTPNIDYFSSYRSDTIFSAAEDRLIVTADFDQTALFQERTSSSWLFRPHKIMGIGRRILSSSHPQQKLQMVSNRV